jgi:SAM-dependent methyltransferase
MGNKEIFYPESRFGGFADVDGTILFLNRVNELYDPSFVLLDVGCGRGVSALTETSRLKRWLLSRKGKVARTIGIDVDERARDNPEIDEFRPIVGDVWPVESDSVDMLVCDYVLEHIEDPEAFFREAGRVMKKGGYVCFRTVNRWCYIAVASRLIPNRLHAKVLAKAQEDREEQDVFETRYRVNTPQALRKRLEAAGFDAAVYTHEAEPMYLEFSKIAYFLGVLHQRYAPRFLKPSLLAFGRKR